MPTETDSKDGMQELILAASDVELLEVIGNKTDPAWSDAAFIEFANRHRDYMLSACSRTAEALNGDAWVADMVEDTFAEVYDQAGEFRVPKDATGNVDLQRRYVRGWMGKIAEFKLRSYLRGHDRESTEGEDGWEIVEKEHPIQSAGVEPEAADEKNDGGGDLSLVHEALEQLNEREQLVIRTTFQFYRIGEKFQRLPNKDADALAKQLNTTPENVRKIRQRAMEKIRDYIAQKDTSQCRKARTI
jgi:RNA polymerase sigma factor (sigma-70 family)